MTTSDDATPELLNAIIQIKVDTPKYIFISLSQFRSIVTTISELCCPLSLKQTITQYLFDFYNTKELLDLPVELSSNSRVQYSLSYGNDWTDYSFLQFVAQLDRYGSTFHDSSGWFQIKTSLTDSEVGDNRKEEGILNSEAGLDHSCWYPAKYPADSTAGYYFKDLAHLLEVVKFLVAGLIFLPVTRDLYYAKQFDNYLLSDDTLLAITRAVIGDQEIVIDPLELERTQENHLRRFHPFNQEYRDTYYHVGELEYDNLTRMGVELNTYTPWAPKMRDHSNPFNMYLEEDIARITSDPDPGDLPRYLLEYDLAVMNSIAPGDGSLIHNLKVRNALVGPKNAKADVEPDDPSNRRGRLLSDDDMASPHNSVRRRTYYGHTRTPEETSQDRDDNNETRLAASDSDVDYADYIGTIWAASSEDGSDDAGDDNDNDGDDDHDHDYDMPDDDEEPIPFVPLPQQVFGTPQDALSRALLNILSYEFSSDDADEADYEYHDPEESEEHESEEMGMSVDEARVAHHTRNYVDSPGSSASAPAIAGENDEDDEDDNDGSDDENDEDWVPSDEESIASPRHTILDYLNGDSGAEHDVDADEPMMVMFRHLLTHAARSNDLDDVDHDFFEQEYSSEDENAIFNEYGYSDASSEMKSHDSSTESSPSPPRLENRGDFGVSYHRPEHELPNRFPELSNMLFNRQMGYGLTRRYKPDPASLGSSILPVGRPTSVACRGNGVSAGTFSRSGSVYAAADREYNVVVYDTSTPEHPKFMKELNAERIGNWVITDIALNNSGNLIAVCSLHHGILLAKNNSDFEHYIKLEDHGRIFSVDFSEDSKYLVAGMSSNHFDVVDLEMANTRGGIKRRFMHHSEVNSVKFSGNSNKLIVSGCDDGYVRLWDTRVKKPMVKVMRGHNQGVTCVDAKGDGNYFLSNGKDHAIKLWDVRTVSSDLRTSRNCARTAFDYRRHLFDRSSILIPGRDESVQTYVGHTVARTLIRSYFSPAETTNQQYIYSGSADGSICIWHLDGTLISRDYTRIRNLDSHDWSHVSGNGSHIPYDEFFEWYNRQHAGFLTRDVSWHPYAPVIYACLSYELDMNPFPSYGSGLGEIVQVPFNADYAIRDGNSANGDPTSYPLPPINGSKNRTWIHRDIVRNKNAWI